MLEFIKIRCSTFWMVLHVQFWFISTRFINNYESRSRERISTPLTNAQSLGIQMNRNEKRIEMIGKKANEQEKSEYKMANGIQSN